MASNAEVSTHQDRTIELLERTIVRSIRDHVRASDSVSLNPSELSNIIFDEVESRVEVIYGTKTKEATRKEYHRHWINAIGMLVRTGQIELVGLFRLTRGRHMRSAA